VLTDLVLGHAWTSLAVAQCFTGAIDNHKIQRQHMSSAQLSEAASVATKLEQEVSARKKPFGDLDTLMLKMNLLPGCGTSFKPEGFVVE